LEDKEKVKKSLFYSMFWIVAMYFTAFWVLYGGYIFIKNLVEDNSFDLQPLYLTLGMLIVFFRSKKEYKKEKG
jgi:hypothetical protein